MKPIKLKSTIEKKIDAYSNRLIEISRFIHTNPEIGFKEYKSSEILIKELQGLGFAVQRGTAELATAFKAEFSGKNGGPVIAFLAEYDALPGIGHACGHNLIAAASLGAGAAVQSIIGNLRGTVCVIGTPAEEGGGGKIKMMEKGFFDDVDISMMIHPFHMTYTFLPSMAVKLIEFVFHGKAAHAAVRPQEGRNALDAVVQTYNAINSLRPHLPNDTRIHGIITDGGQAPNIISERAAIKYAVRTTQQDYLPELLENVICCARGAAMASRTDLEINKSGIEYASLKNNLTIEKLLRKNLHYLSIEIQRANNAVAEMGSLDMGNISRKMPSAHPFLAICNDSAPHTELFKKAAISGSGHEMMLKGAKLLAYTAVDLLYDTDLYQRAKKDFERSEL